MQPSSIPQPPNNQPQEIHTRKNTNKRMRLFGWALLIISFILLAYSTTSIVPILLSHTEPDLAQRPSQKTPPPTPTFNPNTNAVLPLHRVVAFYAVPGAEPTGPAYVISDDMLTQLKQQANAYQQIDLGHPVQAGIDLVVSVPDSFPGPQNTYSHHIDPDTIQQYINFCQQNNLILFLDLNFGQTPIMDEVNAFLLYLERYPFVHMAIDPEWMFPRRDGIPGTHLSNVRASDLNPIIKAVADIPQKYHLPRKILIIHQYRGNGDTLANPYDAAQAEIADKRNILSDPRVDVVFHIDSVGGYSGDHDDKIQQYTQWVQQDMCLHQNFSYGGFKLFYKIEAKTGLMTPQEVLSLEPSPMVITYGN